MNAIPKRFQLSLSTAITVMIIAGLALVPLLSDIWWTLFTHADNKNTPILQRVVIGILLSAFWSSIILIPAFILGRWISERKWAKAGVAIGVLVITLILIAFTPVLLPIPYQLHAVLFRERMRWTVDFNEIQKWNPAIRIPSYGIIEIPAETWPPCVKSLSPLDIRLLPDGKSLEVLMGGCGFGHWGLIISPPGMNTPPGNRYEHRFPLKQGVDVFESE